MYIAGQIALYQQEKAWILDVLESGESKSTKHAFYILTNYAATEPL